MKFGSRLSRKPSSDGSVGSGPLHALKKVGFSLRRSNPEPLEYAACKAELDGAVKGLSELLETSEASRKAWKEIVRCKIEFGERFVNGVGEGHSGSAAGGSHTGKGIGAEGGIGVEMVSEGSRGFEREVGGMMGNEGVVYGGLEEVRHYIEMMKGIQGKYRIVAKAKSEYEFYMKKLKGLQGKSGKDDALARTVEKFELSKGLFNGYVECMVKMIRAAVAKKEAAFQALFDAHYILQAKMVRIMSTHETQIHVRAAADESLLAQLSLCSGLDDPTKRFDDITAKCQTALDQRSESQQQSTNGKPSRAHPPLAIAPTRQLSLPPPVPPHAPNLYDEQEPNTEDLPMPSAPTQSILALGAK